MSWSKLIKLRHYLKALICSLVLFKGNLYLQKSAHNSVLTALAFIYRAGLIFSF